MIHPETIPSNNILVYGICFVLLVVRVCCDTCVYHDVCSCRLHGKDMVTLRPLDLSNHIRFKLKQKGGYLIHYNPCTPFNQPDHCHETLGCQYVDGKKALTYGLADPTSHQFSVENKNVVFKYSHVGQNGFTRYLQVTLICDRSAHDPKASAVQEDKILEKSTYSFNLTTKCACAGVCSSEAQPKDKGISFGSILVILLFVILLLYFIGGFLFLKFYKKEEGLDMIPHREFWVDLPAKVKDGCIFTWGKIHKKDTEYEQI